MNIIFFVFLQSFLYVACYAAENVLTEFNSYKGTVITAQTINDLAPTMPADLEKAVTPWLVKNAALLTQLAHTPCPLNTDILRTKKVADAQAIQQSGLSSLSAINYVLPSPKEHNPNFVIKLNSVGTKLFNLFYNVDIDLKKQKEPDGVVRLSNCIIDYDKIEDYTTQLTTSRIAHYLLLKKVSKKYAFKHITFSKPFLCRIPGRPEEVCDANYVTVEQYIDGLETLNNMTPEQASEKIKNMPSEMVTELYYCATRAAIWDLIPKNCVFNREGNIAIIDFESGYDHKLRFFFYQGNEGEENFFKTTADGLDRLYRRILHYDPTKQHMIVDLARNDQDLMQAYTKYQCMPAFLMNRSS